MEESLQTRKELRLEKKRRRQRVGAVILSAAVLVGAGTAYSLVKTYDAAYATPYELLPSDVTSYTEVTFAAIAGQNTSKASDLLDFVKNASKDDKKNPTTHFIASMEKYVKTLGDSEVNGLGSKYIEMNYGKDKQLAVFSYVNKNAVKKILEAENCSTLIPAMFCQEGTLVKNGWVIGGDTDYYNKDTIKTDNLSLNVSFNAEINNKTNDTLLTLWRNNTTEYVKYVPLNLGLLLPKGNHTTSYVNAADGKVELTTEIHPKKGEKHFLFNNPKDANPNIAALPENSVFAVSTQTPGKIINMLESDKRYFKEVSPGWDKLVAQLQAWGMTTKTNEKTFGKSVSLSLNESQDINKMGGVLMVSGGDIGRIAGIMSKAADKDSAVTMNYQLMQADDGTLQVQAHNPVMDGFLQDNTNFAATRRTVSGDPILQLYVDIDATKTLIDRNHKVDDKNKEGVITLDMANRDGIVVSQLVWHTDGVKPVVEESPVQESEGTE